VTERGKDSGHCPKCGAEYEPLQEYCLECGDRLPAGRGPVGMLAAGWQRRIPWYPGDWIWQVLLFVGIAAVATAISTATTSNAGTTIASRNDGDDAVDDRGLDAEADGHYRTAARASGNTVGRRKHDSPASIRADGLAARWNGVHRRPRVAAALRRARRRGRQGQEGEGRRPAAGGLPRLLDLPEPPSRLLRRLLRHLLDPGSGGGEARGCPRPRLPGRLRRPGDPRLRRCNSRKDGHGTGASGLLPLALEATQAATL
jgi:hypothetical protein